MGCPGGLADQAGMTAVDGLPGEPLPGRPAGPPLTWRAATDSCRCGHAAQEATALVTSSKAEGRGDGAQGSSRSSEGGGPSGTCIPASPAQLDRGCCRVHEGTNFPELGLADIPRSDGREAHFGRCLKPLSPWFVLALSQTSDRTGRH